MVQSALPPANMPMIDAGGFITQAWYHALDSLLRRTGGTAVDLVGNGLSVSTTGIVVATGTGPGAAVTRTLAAGTGLNIANGTGLAGNPSYSLKDTAVTADSYGDDTNVPTFTVDGQGRITAAADVAITFPVVSVAGKTGTVVLTATDVGLADVSNKKQLPVDGTDAMTAPITLKSYTVAGLPSVGAAKLAYASDGRKNGEGAGLGTGVLVFSDASHWIACDSGATVAA